MSREPTNQSGRFRKAGFPGSRGSHRNPSGNLPGPIPPGSGNLAGTYGNLGNLPSDPTDSKLLAPLPPEGLAPPLRAARKVCEPASETRLRSASRRAVALVPAGSWPGGPAARALGRSAYSGQRRRRRGRPASLLPSGCRPRQQLLRDPGLQPGALLQAFENSALVGGVRRRVRCFARGIRPILRLLIARVSKQREPRTRVFLWPAEAA
jgi:hypothetical protein